jgi:nucleoside-diphosphate kinase
MSKVLILLKPDVSSDPDVCTKILQELTDINWGIDIQKIGITFMFDRLTAEQFYCGLKGADHFESQINFITSGPCVAFIITSELTIPELRKKIGNTNPQKAEPGTIRYKYGTVLPKNAVHCSDSSDSAEREINILTEFFKNKNKCLWR